MRVLGSLRFFANSIRGVLLLVLLAILIPILLVQAAHYYSMFQTQRTAEFRNNLELARAVATTFEAFTGDVRHQELAIGLALTSPEEIPIDQANRILSAVAIESPAIDSYNWVNPRGMIIASSLPEAIGLDISDRPYFQDIAIGQEWVVSDLFIGRVTGKPIFVIARGTRAESGTLLGVVFASVDPDRLDEVLTIDGSGTAAYSVLDRSGRLVYWLPEVELTWEQRDLAESDPTVNRALAGEEATGTYRSPVDRQQRMVARSPIRSIGWVAGASRTESEVMAPLIRDLLGDVGLILMVTVLALAIAIVVSRRITVPLRGLEEYAIALGRGEYGRKAKIGGPVELARLGEAFNAMADEVQQALRLREEFLTIAAHELRTPLTVIRGYSQLLRQQETDGKRAAALHTIIKQIDRMNDLLNDMMVMAEIRAGHLDLHKEQFDLVILSEEVADRMQLLAEKHQLAVKGETPVVVEADHGQIEAVLTNLVDNAIRYSPEGGKVEIAVSRKDAEVITAVKDYGLGIPQEKQIHLFEPFFQIYPAIAGFGGLGLGLYMSKQIIEWHGGRMWFTSAEGKGSTFYFSLPTTLKT